MHNTLKIAAYIRLATSPNSPGAQIAYCSQAIQIAAYCDRHFPGCKLTYYSDIGYAAYNHNIDRPGYTEMCINLMAGKHDVLIVSNTSRLWRDSFAFLLHANALLTAGVRIISINDDLDLCGRDAIYSTIPGIILTNYDC